MVEQQRSPRSGHSGPRFWTSPSQRNTYASYPDAWEQNYLSTLDDFKAFSFGNPNFNRHEAEQDARDPRWKIVNRQGDETSSSSSSEEKAQRRRRRNTRDITPRASVASLDALADQQSTPARPRSHPSQTNYYDRGTSVIVSAHPSELDLAPYETQSEYSGYEAGRSYPPSLDISISSSKVSFEAISISSSRQSSEGDTHAYEAFSHIANNSGLGGAMGSSSALSVSSLRCDDDEDTAISDAQMPSSLPELHPVSRLDSISPTTPFSSGFDHAYPNSNQRPEDWHRPYPSSASSPTHLETLEAKPRSRLRSVSTSGSVSSTASSHHPFDTDKEFDMAYITSGLALNFNNANPTDANASLDFVRRMSRTATGSPSRGPASNSIQANMRIESGRSGPIGWEDDPSVVPGFAPTRARAATTTSVSPSTYTTRAPMTVSLSPGSLLEGDTSSKIVGTVASASGSGDATSSANRSTAVNQPNAPTSSRPSSATPSRPHVLPALPTSSKLGSPSSAKSLPLSNFDSVPTAITGTNQIDLTTLIRENEINSMDGMLHVQAQGIVKRKKSNLLSGLGIGSLGVLGIGSSKIKASASVTRDMSPDPGSPSKSGRANISFGIEEEGHKGPEPPSSSSSPSPSLPAAAVSRTTPASEKSGLMANALPTSSEPLDHPALATASVGTLLSLDAAGDNAHLIPTSETPLTFTINSNANTEMSSSITLSPSGTVPAFVSPRPLYPRPPSITSFRSLNSTSFSYDDSFARGLVVWGGAEYMHMRREWVIRMDKRKDEGKGKGKAVKEAGKNKEHVDIWQGLPPGAEEVWANFLLGKFYVSREDVYPRSQRRGVNGGVELSNTDPHRTREGRGGTGSGENNHLKELRRQKQGEGAAEGEVQGKPPQHRLIIKRLRDDQDRPNMTITQPGDPNIWRRQNGSSLGLAVIENTDIDVNVNGRRYHSLSDSSTIPSVPIIKQPTLSQESPIRSNQDPRIIIPVDSKSATTGSRPQFDSQHPTILVHKHSKVAAFSISRQHRDRDRDRSASKGVPGSPSSTTTGPFSGPSPPVDPSSSSSARLHVVMLAQRAIQESFTTTETTKKFGTVIDRHEAVRAAFSPGYHVGGRSKEKDIGGKKRSSPTSSTKMKHNSGGEHKAQVKSDGQIELARADGEFPTSGFGLRYVKSRPRGLRSARNSVGTRSAPVYKLSTQSQIEEESIEDQGQHEVDGQDNIPSAVSNDSSSAGGRNYQRTYGTLDQPSPEISNASASPGTQPRLPSVSSQNQDSPMLHSRSSSIFKRFLPWGDVSSSTASSKGSSTVGSISTTQSVSSVNVRDTTSTSSMNSDFSVPFVPPWVSLASRDQHDIQRRVLGQLEHSFENVGLLPSKEKKSSQKGATHVSNLISRHKKLDVLSCVPVDSFFMVLPLWPAETDAYSQRLVPFEVPSIPLESRRYLLVFYKTLDVGTKQASSSSSVTATDARNVLIPGFRAIARQVSYNDLQGTCIRAPEQGLSVSGPLEDAFSQMPRANSTTTPSSPNYNDCAAQLSVIGSCYSRESGVEFDPEALIELDLCTVLSGEKKTLPPGMVTEQFDSEQSMTVKLTPIGSAVMEMVWVGGLALMSFSSQTER